MIAHLESGEHPAEEFVESSGARSEDVEVASRFRRVRQGIQRTNVTWVVFGGSLWKLAMGGKETAVENEGLCGWILKECPRAIDDLAFAGRENLIVTDRVSVSSDALNSAKRGHISSRPERVNEMMTPVFQAKPPMDKS